jgi:hypothetical protein
MPAWASTSQLNFSGNGGSGQPATRAHPDNPKLKAKIKARIYFLVPNNLSKKEAFFFSVLRETNV